ncbi:MAG TPA: hypothetical protein VI277_04745 [Candidatus Limnocylindria bacterium]
MTVRHPIRGLFGGLIFGFGLAFILIFLSVAILGTWTVIGFTVAFGLIGLVVSLVWPPKQETPGQ